ncbi:hypothetical protein SAMN05216358_0070 [Rhizobium sp. AN5]|uniref:hypothetical protein n=1 Tax=Rhizobium sp. AN5 TaxID=1855304 RepID=UPI000BD9859D|nr:hypothetical protein [Rhizobium sp. AN5]SOC90051.1 hypothetical protein SAMN05216358_0070 [Rhizobium sp. AN5]
MSGKRIKVGDVEVSIIRDPDPAKTGWLVVRYRPRTHEYLSKQPAQTREMAEYLFTQVAGQEGLRQKRAAEQAVAAISVVNEMEGVLGGEPFYRDHPDYARF